MATKRIKKQQFRHQNGFGSIVKLSGKRRKPFAVRITTGWEDGKQVRKYLGYYASEAEALMALAEYHKGGFDIDFSSITLNEVYDMWMKRLEKKDLSVSVMRIHNMAKSRFGRLGTMRIRDIKKHHLQDWLDESELKPNSKAKLRSTLHQIFTYALDNDIIVKNYAANLEINEKVEKTGSIFTAKEIDTLWKHKDDRFVQQLLIMIYTGMRIGELLAVKRDHINFEESYLIGGSKTDAGKDRVIPIHHKVMPLILEQLGDRTFLVQSKTQIKGMSYTHIRRKYDKLNERFGMEHNPHDCRKTAVSLMHTAGIPMEVIRVIVGHSGKGVTEKVYFYKEPKELVEFINKIQIDY